MNRPIAYSLLVGFAVLGVAASFARPEWISDQNAFMRDFVGINLLNLLGVILAITLASIASIHLAFNAIEERAGKRGLHRSRQNLKKAAYWLLGLFFAGVVLVIAKPIAALTPLGEGLFNVGALTIVLWHILILVSLTELTFAIEPNV